MAVSISIGRGVAALFLALGVVACGSTPEDAPGVLVDPDLGIYEVAPLGGVAARAQESAPRRAPAPMLRPARAPKPSMARSPGRFDIDNLCSVYAAHPDWRRIIEARSAAHGVLPVMVLATLRRESAFKATAANPGSSAYGYAQAMPGAWGEYRSATRNPAARRDDFSAAADFIAWRLKAIAKRHDVDPRDAIRLSLAYNLGDRGYRERRWESSNPAAMTHAKRVHDTAHAYADQAPGCADDRRAAVPSSAPGREPS